MVIDASRAALLVVWTQNPTLTMDAVTAAPQEIRDLLREMHDQLSQMLLAG